MKITKFKDIRWHAFIMLIIVLLMGGLIALYMIITINHTEKTMVEQQKVKLAHIAELFDKNFEGDYHDILESKNLLNAPKQKKLKALNQELRDLAMQFTEIYPGINIGCYSYELNSIIVGGSNFNYYDAGELGEQESYIKKVVKKTQPVFINNVEEMQYLKPLIRYGKIIGAVWVVEDMSREAYRIGNTKRNIYFIFIGSLLFSLLMAVLLLLNYMRNVTRIKNGLSNISNDFNISLPNITGELGEVSKVINDLGKQLKEIRSLTSVVVESVDEGIAVIDESGEIVLANGFAASILRSLDQDGNQELKKYLAERKPTSVRKMRWSAEGKKAVFLVDSVPLRDKILDKAARVITFKDITDEENYEQKIRTSERFAALGKMVAGVAHEIRNPLTSIDGYIQFWRKKGIKLMTEDALDTISKEISRLNILVEKLLFFAKPANMVHEKLELNNIINEIITFMKITFPKIKFEYINEITKKQYCISGDKEQIRSALENIFYNAVQAMQEEGKISIKTSLRLEEKYFCVTVLDTGTGISVEHLAYVFDPFFTTKPKGTGLGLAITYEIIKLHQGDIEVESKKNKGTKLTVCLPYKEENPSV